MSDITKAVILARVSTKSQEEEGYSLESQVKLLQSYCENRGLMVMHVFKIAETASKSTQRRTFQKALQYIEDNGIKDLIIEKVDRHVRNLNDAVETHDWLLADEERKVHFVKDGLVLHKNSRSQEWLNWGIRVVMAKNYIDNLREEAMKGWAEKLAQGWRPTAPLFGYKTEIQNGKRIHVPDPSTAPIVKEMFRLYLHPSHSVSSIQHVVYDKGGRTAKGRPFGKSLVYKMLNNPFYMGVIHFDGKEYPGAHIPLIDKKMYQRVQDKLHGKRPAVMRTHNPLFKNLLRCENCGGVISWQLQKGRYYGRCQRLKPTCKHQKSLREDYVEEAIVAKLNDLVAPSASVIDWVIKGIKSRYRDQYDAREAASAQLQQQITRIGRMLTMLYDDKLSGEISRSLYDTKKEQLSHEKSELEEKYQTLEASAINNLEQRIALLKLSQKASEIYRTRSIDQKRLIIIKLFETITADNGIVSVNYTKFAAVVAQKTLKTKEIIGG